jgi:hypothetical protein
LLTCGSVHFYEIESTQRRNVTNKDGQIQPNPILADCEGVFPDVVGHGGYKVEVQDRSGNPLVTIDWLIA